MTTHKREILKRANNWVAAHNTVCNGKFRVAGFHLNEDGTEYMLLKSDYKTIYYGLIEIIESHLGLKFFGTTTIKSKTAIMFFSEEGETI